MFGLGTYPIRGSRRPEGICLWGSFAPNGASTPLAASFRGSLRYDMTVAYTATGIYTVTLADGFVFPEDPVIVPGNGCADVSGTNRFSVVQVAPWSNTTRTFTIQALQEAVAFAVPAATGNRITFTLDAVNSGGR
jgi:hypothetical protein